MEKYGYVFYVTHQYFVEIDADGDCVNEVKEIGVYSRKRLAEQAIRRFAGLPGFVKHPDGFAIAKQRCYLQHASRVSELHMVYAPYHEQYLPASDCDEVTRGASLKRRTRRNGCCRNGGSSRSLPVRKMDML